LILRRHVDTRVEVQSMSSELTQADAAVFETFVVPRYLALFGDLALQMLLVGESARVAHLGCRTGYPNQQLVESFEQVQILAVDGSAAALEQARGAATGSVEYACVQEPPLDVAGETFSHVLAIHPVGDQAKRAALYGEAHRLLYPGGQFLVSVPLRGSFQELGDLLREYALKHDEDAFGDRVEKMMAHRATVETLAEQLEELGFDDVDVEFRATELIFDSGRAFFDDPITRLMVVPELMAELGVEDLSSPMAYLRDAIDRYWAEHEFELTLNVGCASARRQ
jgi:SAM-dependent methyltransferase